MIVAGEASGDNHAARLIDALRECSPGVEFDFFGASGQKMRDAGVEAVVNPDDFAIVGVTEIVRALPMFLRAFRTLKQSAIERKPDVVILVDFPEFNLKLAKSLKKQGFRVVYYISPQLWAWRKYRVTTIRNYVDLMLTILPFEKDWYQSNGVKHVEYVGNPLANEVHASTDKDEFCAINDLDPTRQIISLLPGSRQTEIVRILPVMLATVESISSIRPDIQFVIAASSYKARNNIEMIIKKSIFAGCKLPTDLKIVTNSTYDALNASDAAAVTSGTATLETGIIGTPLTVVYKGSALNYKLLRPLIDVEHFGMINLIAGERIAKELIQDDLTPEKLAEDLFRLLEPEENAKVRIKLRAAVEKLGTGGASKRAAEAIINLIS